MMSKAKKIILTLLLTFSIGVTAQTNNSENFDWTPVMEAIIQIESKGKSNARDASGLCVGILQIKSILVSECNQILARSKSKKRYSDGDRYSAEKSKEMFILLQEHFNKGHSIEKAIRWWNAGFYWEKAYGTESLNKKTQGYYERVMKEYNKRN